MIASVDIETRGLDARRFIMGTLITENKKKPEVYHKKEELWNRIRQIAEAQHKRNKTIQLYAHNHAYDFYGYANIEDENIKYFSQRPFIANLTVNNKEVKKELRKEICKFLDTHAIFRMPLKELAEMIGMKKLEMPKELESNKGKLTKKRLKLIEEYNINDTRIVLESIKFLKEKLEEEDIKLKRLMTINQIAIQYLITKLRKLPDKETEHLFYNKNKGEFYRTFRREEIHEAYRGGRVEAWKTGKIKNTTSIDKRNLYGYSLSIIDIPDLRTERKTWRPQTTTPQTTEQIISKIGITRCLVKNKTNKLGLLPVRTPTGNYYPKEGRHIIGTWTNIELQKAIKEGYEIIFIEWTVSYEKATNPFRIIMPETYKKRIENKGNKFNYWFYKNMQNNGIGKLAQHHTNQEIIIDSVEESKKYLEKKYEIMKGIGLKYMYKKKDTTFKPKKYYVPIIPTLVNARARLIMYEEYKKIPYEDLVYTDTDSIKFTGDHLHKFEIGEELGQFKIENTKEEMIIYGKKTYLTGNEIKISGIRKKGITKEQFEKGIVKNSQMITINTTKNISEVGGFTNETRNLNTQKENFIKIEELYEENKIFIDQNINDLENYMETIQKII